MPDEVVRIQTLDGAWIELGHDRYPGIFPEALAPAADQYGPSSVAFTIDRPPADLHPDLSSYTPCEIEIPRGRPVWKGRIRETPGQSTEQIISVQGEGMQFHLDDDQLERAWIHTALSDWVDTRTRPMVDLSVYKASGKVEASDGVIVIGWEQGADMQTNQRVGVTLDLKQADAARVIVDLETIGIVGSPFTLACVGHDQDDAGALSPSWGTTDTYWSAGAPASGKQRGTCPGGRIHRYLTIWLNRDNTPGAAGGDRLVRIKSILVVRDVLYESGDASFLTAAQVVKDVRPSAPLLSTDDSQIALPGGIVGGYYVPDLATEGLQTPRQVIDRVDGYQGWKKQVDAKARLVYKPRSNAPMFVVRDTGAFDDASMNSGEEIYNRAIVSGTGPDGTPLRVERFAENLLALRAMPGAGPPNPSADVDASGWVDTNPFGQFTRDTGVFESSPASIKWNRTDGGIMAPSSHKARTTAVDWKVGTNRTIRLAVLLRANAACLLDVSWNYVTGTIGSDRYNLLSGVSLAANTWKLVTIDWRPPEPVEHMRLELQNLQPNPTSPTALWIDSVTVSRSTPTLLDRRNFYRTRNLDVRAPTNIGAMQQLGDAFLQAHQSTPLKGSLRAERGTVLRLPDEEEIDPAELLLWTSELILFAGLRDPNTGARGRVGTIDTVTYDAAAEVATASIDNSRDNLEILMERMDVVTGAGK